MTGTRWRPAVAVATIAAAAAAAAAAAVAAADILNSPCISSLYCNMHNVCVATSLRKWPNGFYAFKQNSSGLSYA